MGCFAELSLSAKRFIPVFIILHKKLYDNVNNLSLAFLSFPGRSTSEKTRLGRLPKQQKIVVFISASRDAQVYPTT